MRFLPVSRFRGHRSSASMLAALCSASWKVLARSNVGGSPVFWPLFMVQLPASQQTAGWTTAAYSRGVNLYAK